VVAVLAVDPRNGEHAVATELGADVVRANIETRVMDARRAGRSLTDLLDYLASQGNRYFRSWETPESVQAPTVEAAADRLLLSLRPEMEVPPL
jgi:hypothetical protein